MFMMLVILLVVLVLSLALAIALIRRGETALGFVLGLAPIGLMELIAQGMIRSDIQDCLDRACASAGLPPGCTIAEFGCTEWSSLSIAVFWIIGLIDVVLYLAGLGIYAAVRAWRE
jgi:hypothetical protein